MYNTYVQVCIKRFARAVYTLPFDFVSPFGRYATGAQRIMIQPDGYSDGIWREIITGNR